MATQPSDEEITSTGQSAVILYSCGVKTGWLIEPFTAAETAILCFGAVLSFIGRLV